ncbi:hypothetical protein JFV30_12165 [Pseudomonas sp. TH32]|uniref:hypothetical protein n=1 Tax=Pseudomonas sp. TH32 TaxID=2796397 RepID=UPI001912FCEC|nr:hypothetical protein [Pseudomonas sp. TH32]MBK5437560.1 hypothetical protein [Pseudomonas sp. TH32]
MKQLLVWTLFGMIMSAPVAVQASDGAEALARWQQQFRQEQKSALSVGRASSIRHLAKLIGIGNAHRFTGIGRR